MKLNLKNKIKQILPSIKQGLKDIKTVIEEGNIRMFVKQGIAILILLILSHYISGALESRDANVKGKIEALQAQQSNEKEYMASKSKLLSLEPRFPDISEKNNWLLKEVDTILREFTFNPAPKVGIQTEDDSNNAYVVVSVPVELTTTYAGFGDLLASIEGRDEFLKVSEFALTKKSVIGKDEALGENTVKLRIDAVLPTEKVAKALFKDASVTGGKK